MHLYNQRVQEWRRGEPASTFFGGASPVAPKIRDTHLEERRQFPAVMVRVWDERPAEHPHDSGLAIAAETFMNCAG